MKCSKRCPVGEISERERSTPIGSGYHDFQDSFSERFNASSWDICLLLDYYLSEETTVMKGSLQDQTGK